MSFKRSALYISSAALLTASACAPNVNKQIDDQGQYWQRAHVSEAIWLQGPKAQQTLNRDIARCVTELRELERLGSIKNSIKTDLSGRVIDPDEKKMEDWDTPEHDKYILAEHTDYHDFEGCMLDKGWERVKYVHYDRAAQARQDYLDTHVDYKYRSRYEVGVPKAKKDYSDLNE